MKITKKNAIRAQLARIEDVDRANRNLQKQNRELIDQRDAYLDILTNGVTVAKQLGLGVARVGYAVLRSLVLVEGVPPRASPDKER